MYLANKSPRHQTISNPRAPKPQEPSLQLRTSMTDCRHAPQPLPSAATLAPDVKAASHCGVFDWLSFGVSGPSWSSGHCCGNTICLALPATPLQNVLPHPRAPFAAMPGLSGSVDVVEVLLVTSVVAFTERAGRSQTRFQRKLPPGVTRAPRTAEI